MTEAEELELLELEEMERGGATGSLEAPPKPPKWAPLYPATAKAAQKAASGQEMKATEVPAAMGLDALSMIPRAVATGAGSIGELIGAIASSPPAEQWDPTKPSMGHGKRLAESAVKRMGQQSGEGSLAENIVRDPANLPAIGIGGLTSGMLKQAPAAVARWVPPLVEGAVSTGIHQAENLAKGKDVSGEEAGTEMALSLVFPALAEAKRGLRGLGAATMRSQIPAHYRRKVGDIAEIMDYVTGRKSPISTVKKEGAKQAAESIADLMASPIPPGTPDDQLWKRAMDYASLDDALAKSGADVPGMQKQVAGVWDRITGIFKGGTKKGTIKELDRLGKELETYKRDVFDVADELTYQAMPDGTVLTDNRKSFVQLLQEVKQDLDAMGNTPLKARVNKEFQAMAQAYSNDYPGQLLPSDLDKLKRSAGPMGAWTKTIDPESGRIIDAADPDLTARELVYNKLYNHAKTDIEQMAGGDIIKQINAYEHQLIPFESGLAKSAVEEVGPFGRIVPILSSVTGVGAAGAGFATQGPMGLLYGLPAIGATMASGEYLRSFPFPRTIYGMQDLFPDITGPGIADIVARQGTRSATQGASR